MKILYIIFLIFVFSCGYPDIDTVPDFNNIKLTEEELLDLCKDKTSDKIDQDLCKE